uniref:Uncharacterized protein n=1 Tax=Arundo donax TaxID=35708 RepID=A0A0A9CVE5_ARUDO
MPRREARAARWIAGRRGRGARAGGGAASSPADSSPSPCRPLLPESYLLGRVWICLPMYYRPSTAAGMQLEMLRVE